MEINQTGINTLFTDWILDNETKLSEEDLLNEVMNYIESQKPEICGKCTPCRDGVIRIETLIKMYQDGTAKLEHLKELMQLTYNLRASRCSVGLDIGKNLEVVLKNNYNTLYGPVRKY